ncbi:hypothetical protein BBJ28_00004857 [Nothophytophthora sp. Chile5]|nr:hypothetical protein BBJ28_00004857 [Nothophytophthora sp. Chile5]
MAAAMEADDEGGGSHLDALVRKLQHPLLKIRARALQNLLFKLRERLVRCGQLEPLQSALVPRLLASLAEAPLELHALHVLQILVQSGSVVLLSSLQGHGAAEHLQRAARAAGRPELQAAYEKVRIISGLLAFELLRQVYITTAPSLPQQAVVIGVQEPNDSKVTAAAAAKAEEMALSRRRREPQVAELEARGWRFAPVALATVDEQHLFEFEVKLRLRTSTDELVAMCAAFRNELLRNFPAEVFLQRPMVLQHLLHLVQQPLLPGSPATAAAELQEVDNEALARAMEVSLGVNYFNELLSPTFSHKRGNLTGAVVMASLKAVESLLSALQLTRRTCLDPVNVVHEPSVHVELFDSYDARRTLYPRASVEVGQAPAGDEGAGLLEHYSLGGAVYRIFMSFLPLLRSSRHPRLHLLNLLTTALPDLPEKSEVSSSERSVLDLEKRRMEQIFDVFSGICRSVVLEKTGSDAVGDDLEFTASMQWKLVELVLRLLRLHPASRYRVERIASKALDGEGNRSIDQQSGIIVIPQRLWEAVKLWIASAAFPEVAAQEWEDDALFQHLSEIDATIPDFLQLKHSSQRDAQLVLDFVAFAKANSSQLLNLAPWEKPGILNLNVAQKAVQIRRVFGDADAEIIADATLQAFWTAMTASGDPEGCISDIDVKAMQLITRDVIAEVGQASGVEISSTETVLYFFHGLVDLVDERGTEAARLSATRRRQFILEVISEPIFLANILLVLAQKDENQARGDAFWGILRLALNAFAKEPGAQLAPLQPVVPLLQHFAYVDPSENASPLQRSAQPELVKVLNRVEEVVSDSTRAFLIGRCLLHQSVYIRKAAASGLRRLLSQLAPASVACLAESREILEDPFGCAFTIDGRNLTLATKLLEMPLPVTNHRGTSDYRPSENELSSQLTKLSHLRKVLSGSSSAFQGMKEAALKELVLLIESASSELFALLEEVGEVEQLLELLRELLAVEFDSPKAQEETPPITQQALFLLRALLLRSRLLRSSIQHDRDLVGVAFPLIFHPQASIRAQMYYMVLLLTCSIDVFVPKEALAAPSCRKEAGIDSAVTVPELIKPTFGLHSSCWTRCFVPTRSLEQHLQANSAVLSEQAASSWVSEVQASINKGLSSTGAVEGERDEQADASSALVLAEYGALAQQLRAATSHGKCLNALYHLLTVCEAWPSARSQFVKEWEADFDRYFAVPPKNERDEVIIGAIVSFLSVMFGAMSRGEQLRALVVVKRKVLPLLKRSENHTFSLQVARLLLNISASKVGDLFLSLAADTDIIATICTKYSTVYATEPVLHALMIEVLLRFANGLEEQTELQLSTPSREKICKRLVEMLSPLLTVVCRHRVPGSFLERDVFTAASQCMIAILRTLPSDTLLATDSPLQHTDSALLLDGSWATRFLFDHVSPVRELGFVVLQQATSPSRLLEMAFAVSADGTECDAVRAEACNVLAKELLQFEDGLPDRQAELVGMLHGTNFAGNALKALVMAFKGEKLLVRSARGFARLIRVLYTQKATLAPHFGDMGQELEAAELEYDVYPLLVQGLSLRDWQSKSDRYSSRCMRLSGCDSEAWRTSLLPAILELMMEVLNLLQLLFRDAGHNQVAFFLMVRTCLPVSGDFLLLLVLTLLLLLPLPTLTQHTTLQFQLMELVQDVHASLTGLTAFEDRSARGTRRLHYEVLELCADTLGVLLVQAFEQQQRDGVAAQLESPKASRTETDLTAVVAKLMEPRHPIEFRVSFARLVPAMAEFRPLGAAATASTAPHDRVFPVPAIRRVSCALQVLLESSPLLRRLVVMKHGLPFGMNAVKESFAAIRMSGGFGAKKARNAIANTKMQDAYALDLCARIEIHMEVVSSLIGGDQESQQLAKVRDLVALCRL